MTAPETHLQFMLPFTPEPAESPDAPWIDQQDAIKVLWQVGFGRLPKMSAEDYANYCRAHCREAEKPGVWTSTIPFDLADWIDTHTVIAARKYICQHTGVISIILLADTHESYVADDFDLRSTDLFIDPLSTSDSLYRLVYPVQQKLRDIRAAEVDRLRGK